MGSPDNGYWITRIAHRIPNANPSWIGAQKTGRFFTAQDESSAKEVLDELGSKYVIIDYEMATAKFGAFAIWAGEDESQFGEEYVVKTVDGEERLMMFLYPEYYRSMCSRLYNFGGEAVVPHNSTVVISYKETTVLRVQFKEITSAQSFATYEEAQEYLESQIAPNYRIVGESPFISPVPLEALEHYQLVHRSDPEVIEGSGDPLSYVKIFEYLP
jgi:dolichyl-diphosphooligosaccharide--protein glycosyltransferase